MTIYDAKRDFIVVFNGVELMTGFCAVKIDFITFEGVIQWDGIGVIAVEQGQDAEIAITEDFFCGLVRYSAIFPSKFSKS